MACAGFILAGAEKKSGGAESRPKGAKIFSAPPVFISAPGAEQTKGGAENLCIPKALIRTFHTSFLTTQ